MLYFSGFGLKNDSFLFEKLIVQNSSYVYGCSYGAIKAFEYVLHTTKKIKRLILFSPAFFNDKNEKFKKLQLISFEKNKEQYINKFIKSCSYPYNKDLTSFLGNPTKKELKELLYYNWQQEKLQLLKQKNITLEIHLGAKDKIINPAKTLDFFKDFSTIYFYKNGGHLIYFDNEVVILN